MQDLQTENDRLHRILDIVDSQPDYVLCCTELGRITFASERTVSLSVKCNMMAKQHHLQRGENGSNNNDSGSNSDSSSGKNSGSLTSGSDSATSHQAFNIGNYNNRVSLETELNSNSCNTIEDNMSNSNRDDSILKHISQLLTPDSLNSTQDYISKVSQCVNQAEVDALPVCEISLADGNSSAGGNTQSTVGYLRVARLYRKSWSQHVDKEEYSNLNVSPREGQSASSKRAAASSPRRGGEEHHATKRSKRNIVAAETEKKSSDSAYPYISAQSLEDAAAVLSALTGLSSQKTNISSDNLVGLLPTANVKVEETQTQIQTQTNNRKQMSVEQQEEDAQNVRTGQWLRSSPSGSSLTDSSHTLRENSSEIQLNTIGTRGGGARDTYGSRTLTSSTANGSEEDQEFNGQGSCDMRDMGPGEDEFILTVRPVTVMLSQYRALNLFTSALSRSTMADHDSAMNVQQVKHEKQRQERHRSNSTSEGSSSGSGHEPFSSGSSLSSSNINNNNFNGSLERSMPTLIHSSGELNTSQGSDSGSAD